ncbi:hypothetical protein MHAE_06162 [Mycobacterium haemophilum DSM 44634]|uniref:LppA family lipoprotein n=1 Tax=Mycobacterium haemophilum TaxID=29311 RepID=UPI0006562A14|nr:LppA family lipoprotein [Mycobacterium haemophilum]AKN16266.1 hypothetical protein B586_06325 [Mycobacterium haemophilum DSM 44634]MCV7339750.1 hypothetical protein [Mycobacterium haemophilum DSM 44634]
MNKRGVVVAVLSAMAAVLTGCVDPATYNPNPIPGHGELDRLQKIVNQRPDLETVVQQLASIDVTIRATITKYSSATQFSTVQVSHQINGCSGPFIAAIGRQQDTDLFFGSPAPTSAQWLQIVTELAPVFAAANFRPNNSAPGSPPLPLGAPNNSQISDDGALINLVNGDSDSPLDYSTDTGCHLPAAWRTAPPPPSMRPGNDPNVHYPYLYESPGGRG